MLPAIISPVWGSLKVFQRLFEQINFKNVPHVLLGDLVNILVKGLQINKLEGQQTQDGNQTTSRS